MTRKETIAEGITLYCGDCREILPTLGKENAVAWEAKADRTTKPDENGDQGQVVGAASVDVIITDPPYSKTTHDGARGRGATTGGKHVLVDFAPITDDEFIFVMRDLTEAARRWVVMTCDPRHAVAAERAGLPVVRWGVWTKADPAPQFTGDRPATGWEMVLMMHREGRKRWNGGGKPATWHTKIVKNGGEHPSQKPLDLISDFVRLFSEPGETVLDPFMGSGTTGVAAIKLGRRFIGIEVEPKYYDVARKRVSEALKQTDLFIEKPAPLKQAALFEPTP